MQNGRRRRGNINEALRVMTQIKFPYGPAQGALDIVDANSEFLGILDKTVFLQTELAV